MVNFYTSKDKTKGLTLGLGIILYLISTCFVSFCTKSTCHSSAEAVSIGWIMIIWGGAGLTWLANPLLILSWFLLGIGSRKSWIFSLLAFLISLSFLGFEKIRVD